MTNFANPQTHWSRCLTPYEMQAVFLKTVTIDKWGHSIVYNPPILYSAFMWPHSIWQHCCWPETHDPQRGAVPFSSDPDHCVG